MTKDNLPLESMSEEKQIKTVASILAKRTARALVRERYGMTQEEADKWGYVKNTWQDPMFQEMEFDAYVEKAVKGDPWEGISGYDAI